MHPIVLVHGLDGATLDLITPWLEQGYLPNLGKLIRIGVSGELHSTYPPLTNPAWSSFITGKSSARHSMLEFFRRQEDTRRLVEESHLFDGQLWPTVRELEGVEATGNR